MNKRRLLERERLPGPPLWEAAWEGALRLVEPTITQPDPPYYWPRWSEGTAGLALLYFALALNTGTNADAAPEQARDAIAQVGYDELAAAAIAVSTAGTAGQDALDHLVRQTGSDAKEASRATWALLRKDCTPCANAYELASRDPLQRYGFDRLASIGYAINHLSGRHAT